MAEPHQVPALAPGRGGECPAQDRRARTGTRRQAQKDGRRVRQFFAPPPIYSLPTRTFPHCFWHFQWLFQPPETRLNSADVPIAVPFCNSDAKGGKKAKAGAKGSAKKDAQLAKGAKGKAKANERRSWAKESRQDQAGRLLGRRRGPRTGVSGAQETVQSGSRGGRRRGTQTPAGPRRPGASHASGRSKD